MEEFPIPDLSLKPEELDYLRRHLIKPDGKPVVPINAVPDNFSMVKIVEPYDFTHKFIVKPGDARLTILELLSSRFPYRATSEWERRIKNGLIRVNGEKVMVSTIPVINDSIEHRNIGVVEPSVPDDINIIREISGYILVDKPAPVPMHPGGRYNRNSIVNILQERGYEKLFIVHRLDAVTSGLVLFATNEYAAKMVSKYLAEGLVKKTYEAVIAGVPEEDEVVINKGIKRRGGFIFQCSDDKDAKEAVTRFKVIHRGNGWTHVSCEPQTGRTHQIRLHLKEWGYPIWNDPLYGYGIVHKDYFSVLQNRAISLVSMGLGFNLP